MRARLIANPSAGTDEAASRLTHLRARLAVAHDLDVVLTGGPGDARHAADDAAARGYERIFVAGGDGTLNEVVNGVVGAANGGSETAVGLLPTGTGNDFAASLGIPADIDEAIDALAVSTIRAVDVGDVNGRLFINASAGGFIADVSEAVDPALKDVAGRLAYLLGGAKALLTSDAFQCRATAWDTDIGPGAGRPDPNAPWTLDHEIKLFAVCNARLIGGGRPIAPAASFDDGRLDVCIVAAIDLPRFLGVLRQIAAGTHVDHPDVAYFQSPRLSLQFDRRIKVNADGEVFETDRCDYHIRPGAIRFLQVQ